MYKYVNKSSIIYLENELNTKPLFYKNIYICRLDWRGSSDG